MFKKTPFFSFLIFNTLISWAQNSSAEIYARGSRIQADSIILELKRGERIFCDSCEIFGDLVVKGTEAVPDTIRSWIIITGSTFHNSISFSYCDFTNEVSLQSNTFGRDFVFWRVSFSADFSVSGSIFKESAYFLGATFRGATSFYGADFQKTADFEYSTFRETTALQARPLAMWFRLKEDTFKILNKLPLTTFQGTVDFAPLEFKDISISWKQLKEHLLYNQTANFKLMKHFEEKRMLDDADGVYLFLKNGERMEKGWYIRYPEYWFIQLTCGYGTRPLNTLTLSGIIIVLFAVFYTKSNAIREIEKEFGHRKRRRKYRIVCKSFWKRFYDALYFSVHTFIIGVVSDWHPTDEFLIRTKKIRLFKFRTLSMIEGALGWILLVLFVVTLTRKFIR
jgi:hypothetical protein